MADIVLKDRNGNDIIYPGVTSIKLNTVDGGAQSFNACDEVEKTIDLDFSEGDMEVSADEGTLISKVTIVMPETLIPDNIVEGRNIAGVDGNRKAVSTDSYIEYTLNDDGKAVMMSLHGFTTVPDGCFAYSTALESIDLTDSPGITSIGEQAFRGCTALTSITIPDGVTSIGKSAFYQCTNLKEITIPDSVTSIGDYAFYQCSALTEITIPDSVTSIGNYAFYNTALTAVTIPDGITIIPQYAFADCKALTTVTMSDKVTKICDRAFYQCDILANVNFPANLETIGGYAFYICPMLLSITIPALVTSIGPNAFRRSTTAGTTVLFEDTTTWYVGKSAGATTTAISSSNLNTKPATYLLSTYVSYYWTKT